MLTHVTFTGWDDQTDLGELAAFCRDQRPGTVEIAVLLSNSRMGEDRYPGLGPAETILMVAKRYRQRTAVHVCGRLARDIMAPDQRAAPRLVATASSPTRTMEMPVRSSEIFVLADRIQVNVPEDFWPTHAEPYIPALSLAERAGRPVIVQVRDPAKWPHHLGRVQYLFDRSGGRGELAEQVPPLTTFQVGYAGGLGPDNVDAFVRRVMGVRLPTVPIREDIAFTSPIWIDMESGIRVPVIRPQPHGEPPVPTYVSVEKCRQVMDAVRWALMPE